MDQKAVWVVCIDDLRCTNIVSPYEVLYTTNRHLCFPREWVRGSKQIVLNRLWTRVLDGELNVGDRSAGRVLIQVELQQLQKSGLVQHRHGEPQQNFMRAVVFQLQLEVHSVGRQGLRAQFLA